MRWPWWDRWRSRRRPRRSPDPLWARPRTPRRSPATSASWCMEVMLTNNIPGRNKKPNRIGRTEPKRSVEFWNGPEPDAENNRTEPDRATTRPKNAGRTASNREHLNFRTEPIYFQKSGTEPNRTGPFLAFARSCLQEGETTQDTRRCSTAPRPIAPPSHCVPSAPADAQGRSLRHVQYGLFSYYDLFEPRSFESKFWKRCTKKLDGALRKNTLYI